MSEPCCPICGNLSDSKRYSQLKKEYGELKVKEFKILLENAALQKRVAELESAQQWHPASEPPEDSRCVLLWRNDITFVGWRVEILGETRYVITAPGLPIMFPPPTHWRDLTPLPEVEE